LPAIEHNENNMDEDRRWQQAVKHFRQAEAASRCGDSEGLAHGLDGFLNILDSLALDPAVAPGERREAARLREKIEAPIRAGLPGLLHRLAIWRDTAPDAGTRAEFADILSRATEQLPAASNARH
jgi:hypothetical protein